MKSVITLIFLAVCILFFPPSFALADSSSVSLNATVVPMNDLDLSGINPDVGPNNTGMVKGASTTRNNDSNTEIIIFEFLAVLLVFLFIKFAKRRQQH